MCFVILVFMYVVAIFGPFIAPLFGFDPYKFDRSAVGNLGGAPVGPWGGISLQHPLGVEWGTGRDILRLPWGLRISLFVATVATIFTVALGVVIGIVAGYVGGRADMIIGRFMDLVLAFPFLLIVLALSGVMTQRLTESVFRRQPVAYHLSDPGHQHLRWPYLARIVRGQVLSLREREFVEAAVAMV